MGLDMYLTGRKFCHYIGEAAKSSIQFENGFRLEAKEFALGYWRKHPDLHGYIIETVAAGHDECQKIDLSVENMQSIIQAIKENQLPKTDGFFFGESVNDTEEKAHAIEIFKNAIEWLNTKDDLHLKSVYYQASW